MMSTSGTAVIRTREQAQARVEQVRAFRAEAERLDAEGVWRLPPEQARLVFGHQDAVLADLARRFDVDLTEAGRQMSLGMLVVSALGAVALSTALFLFFYRFWNVFSVPVQVGLLTAAPLLSGLGVGMAARRERTLYFASILALVSFAAFVLDLSVIGALFNLPASPGAFLAWALFAFVLAYAHGLRLMLLAGIVCTGVWTAAMLVSLTGASWGLFMLRPEGLMLAGALALAAAWLEARRGNTPFAQVYRVTASMGVLLPVLWLSAVGELSYLPLQPDTARHIYDVVGFVLGGGAAWLAIRRRWTETLNVSGLFLVAFLCLKLYDWCWDWMPRYLFFLVAGGIAIGLLVGLQRLRARTARGSDGTFTTGGTRRDQ